MLRDILLKRFLLEGTGLSILASQECFFVESDLSEEQPPWTGGEDSDPVLRKESWKIGWEARVQPGLLAMKLSPPATLLRLPDLRANLGRFQGPATLRQRQVILLELAAFDGYWPPRLTDLEFQRLFMVTEFHQEYLVEATKALGFAPITGTEIQAEIDAFWESLCPEEGRPLWRETDDWPMTIRARAFAAPFLKHHPLLVVRPEIREERPKLLLSALSSIGVGMIEAVGTKDVDGALGAGGILLDEQNPRSWDYFDSVPVITQALIAAKLLACVKRFVREPEDQADRTEIIRRMGRLIAKAKHQAEGTGDPDLRRKRQVTVALLTRLELALQS